MSDSKGAAKGENWRNKLYFDSEADKPNERKLWLTENELLRKLDEFTDTKERIRTVIAYKNPLLQEQVTSDMLYHLFIVFETDNWWWSIEKNGEGLTIQRSKKIEAVRDRYRQEARTFGLSTVLEGTHLCSSGLCVPAVTEVKSDRGRKTIRELIIWLQKEKWLFCKYNLLTSNCQHFGEAVYKYVTGTESSVLTNILATARVMQPAGMLPLHPVNVFTGWLMKKPTVVTPHK